MKQIIIFILSVLLFSCSQKQEKRNSSTDTSDTLQTKINTFQTPTGWGYDISIKGQPYIHQPNIPAVPGNSGFKTEEQAKIAAEFVITKIRKNILPPTVSPEELDSLKVL